MLDVGLIGLGPDWERRYRPALKNLQRRLRVRTVYLPTLSLADQAAQELSCSPAQGLRQLLARPDLRAVLLLDTSWLDELPALLACEFGKPVYLACHWDVDPACLRKLAERAADRGLTLAPDLAHRYTPATNRLRELIAARLGRPTQIRISAELLPPDSNQGVPVSASGRQALVDLLDWCGHVLGLKPATVECTELGDGYERVAVEFRRAGVPGDPVLATVDLHGARVESNGSERLSYRFAAEVTCQRGQVNLQGPHDLSWKQGPHREREQLDLERPAEEMMLDHFARRVVGGLVPVPTLEDVFLAQSLAELARESKATGKRCDVTD